MRLLDGMRHSHPNKYTGHDYYLAFIFPLTKNMSSISDNYSKNMLTKPFGYVRQHPFFILRTGGENYDY